MNDNNSNSEATETSEKNSKYSSHVDYVLDSLLRIFYGLSHLILTGTL